MKILTAILTSEHPSALKAAIKQMSDIPDLVIFVHTWDKNYSQWVVDTFSEKYKVVVADQEDQKKTGFPGHGKNFVLKYFLDSDYTHLIPIDGDDFLWPGSWHKMRKLIEEYPADCYFYEYTDQLYEGDPPNTGAFITSTKEWFKTLYAQEIYNNSQRKIPVDKISTYLKRLKYNFDVDRIAIETKKSAEYRYVDDVVSLEDVHRCLRLKHDILCEKLKGYSVSCRDFYVQIKHLAHRTEKNRLSLRNSDIEVRKRSKELLETLNWSEEDEQLMRKRIPNIQLDEDLEYKEKINYIGDLFPEIDIRYSSYINLLIGNPFKHYDVTNENIDRYYRKIS